MRCDVRRRGLTLVEVMVAGVLGLLLLFVIVSLLLPALRLSARGTTLVDIDQRAALLEQRLERALKSTGYRGVHISESGASRHLSVHPILGAVANSKPNLSPTLTVFSWDQDRLRESEVALPEAPQTLTALPDGQLLAALADSPTRSLIEGVSEFEVTLQKGPVVELRFRVEKGTESLEVIRLVSLVNS